MNQKRAKHLKKITKILLIVCCIILLTGSEVSPVSAALNRPTEGSALTDGTGFSLDFNGESANLSGTLRILIILTIVSLAPSILIMFTSFTRIIIVLHFVRTALSTNSSRQIKY